MSFSSRIFRAVEAREPQLEALSVGEIAGGGSAVSVAGLGGFIDAFWFKGEIRKFENSTLFEQGWDKFNLLGCF
jgi:hypothetical protein